MNDVTASPFDESEAGRLSRILGLHEEPGECWSPRDRAAMLQHQLAAKLDFDLSGQAGSDPERTAVSEATSQGIERFRDLLVHPSPPKHLLSITKSFFKMQSGPAASGRRPEHEVAFLMYIATILAARVRASQSISKLRSQDLVKAIDWALAQDWLDPDLRGLFVDARKIVGVAG